MKALRILGLTLIVLAVAVAGGCGGDNGEDEADTTTGTTEPSDGAAATEISMDEFLFDPVDAEVKQGETIEVTNDGSIAHNLTIEKGPDPKEKSDELAGTSTFVGGRSEDLKVDLEPGKYSIVCTVPGHRQAGMTGTITVK